jgi:predicted metalloprotease
VGVVLALGFVAIIIACGVVVTSMAADESSAPAAGPSAAPSQPAGSSGPASSSAAGPESSGSTGSNSANAPSGARAATASPLYQVGSLNGYNCRGRQIVRGAPSSFAAFLNATANCLDRSWSAAFRESGIPFDPPTRVFWTTPGRSPCGSYPAPGAAAFYCPLNDAMYIGVEHAQNAAGGLPVQYNVAYAREVAHEYGHHVQEQAGILDYGEEARTAAGSIEERNAVTRRSELQAQCLAGAFMSAVRPTFPVTRQQWLIALRDSYGRGDNPATPGTRDHGSRRHYASWLNYAFVRGAMSACNTWTAGASMVS